MRIVSSVLNILENYYYTLVDNKKPFSVTRNCISYITHCISVTKRFTQWFTALTCGLNFSVEKMTKKMVEKIAGQTRRKKHVQKKSTFFFSYGCSRHRVSAIETLSVTAGYRNRPRRSGSKVIEAREGNMGPKS